MYPYTLLQSQTAQNPNFIQKKKMTLTFHTQVMKYVKLTCVFAHRRIHHSMKLTSDRRPRAIPDDMAVYYEYSYALLLVIFVVLIFDF